MGGVRDAIGGARRPTDESSVIPSSHTSAPELQPFPFCSVLFCSVPVHPIPSHSVPFRYLEVEEEARENDDGDAEEEERHAERRDAHLARAAEDKTTHAHPMRNQSRRKKEKERGAPSAAATRRAERRPR